MAHVTHTVPVQLPDGSTIEHTAEALRYWHESDGCIVVEAACCGKLGGTAQCPLCLGLGCAGCGFAGQVKLENTRSLHSFYDLGRDTAAGPIDPVAEITAHVQRVAEHHAAVHRARVTSLDGLVKHPPGGLP
jgi:hypothetical protein